MLEKVEFEALLELAKSGDMESLTKLVQDCEPELRLIVRRRLGKELRPFLDSVDLLQSVFRSVLIGFRDQRFDISSQANLLALSSTIVQRKIAKQWRKLQRQKQFDLVNERSVSDLLLSLHSQEVDSAKAFALSESVLQILNSLDPMEKSLIELRLEGHNTAEVAAILNSSSDVLRVKLSRIRKRLREAGLIRELLQTI